jgi:multiple sugar transport system permease protein
MKKRKNKPIIFHSFMIIISIIMAIPFFWMLSSSFKESYDIVKVPPVWFPKVYKWENYTSLFTEQPTGLFIINSFKITLSVVVGQLFFSSLAGYAFARIKFKFRDSVFFLYIATLMIPSQVSLVPLYLIMSRIGWLDTFWPLILPGFFSAFGVFMLRQFFLTLPIELEEAAELDGCNPFQTFYKIMLPLVKPALATLGVFTFMGNWNDLIGPLIFLSSPEKFPLTLGLTFFQGIYTSQWNYIMAGGIVSVIPILVIYFAAQSYFEKGIALSGIKG